MNACSNMNTMIEASSIMGILPHRYPFLLIDRVLECKPGEHITGIKNVTRCEPMLTQAEQSLPHLIVVEALAQLSVILAFKTLDLLPTGGELVFFAGIENAKFGRIVRCGDRMMLRSELRRIRQFIGWFQARASSLLSSSCPAAS